MGEIEHDYLPVTLEIGALMDRYKWFFDQLDEWVAHGNAERLLRVKRDAMNDFANILLRLKSERNPLIG